MPASQRGADIRRAIAEREAAEKLAAAEAVRPPEPVVTRDPETPPVAAKNKKEH